MVRGLLVALVIAGVGVAMFIASSSVSQSPRTSPFPPPRNDGPTGFAADRPGAGQKPAVEIDGQRYMSYLKAVCDIGPRISGTRGMIKQQELIADHFKKLELAVKKQTFEAKQTTRAQPIEMTNMIISIFPEKKNRVILCAHYDTRPIADQEPDPRKWREPFVSANDGGSGVAFLMELGHHLPKLDLNVGVDFVLFDGEEFIFDPNRDQYFLGSKHFAQTWRKSADRPNYLAAILFDMIAGKLPRFPVEGHSYMQAPELTADLWRIASDLRCRSFSNEVGARVLDDHLSLLDVGIPATDIIDFNYPHWHRLSDTPENCAPEGPTEIARVVSIWLERLR